MNTKMVTMMMIDDTNDDGYHLTFLFQQRSRVLQHYEWPARKATCVTTMIRDKQCFSNLTIETCKWARSQSRDYD